MTNRLVIKLKTLLVVDDEKGIIVVIRSYFQDNGYVVISAENAGDAKLQAFDIEHQIETVWGIGY